MIACQSDAELLRFLEGELNADADARIVAHIEDCIGCQERLERLTGASPVLGGVEPIETVHSDTGATRDLAGTEVVAADVGEDQSHGESSESQPTDPRGETRCRIDTAADPERTSDFSLSSTVNRDGDTDDASPDGEAIAKAPDGIATADVTDGEPEPSVRKRPDAGWPTIPGYEILQRLGEGGMGVVYKARQLGLKRLVALKMIRGGSQARADHLSRFRVEAEAVARLRHPNIIQIYDIGEATGLPFVALELLDGGGLDDRLAGDPQPGRTAAEIVVTLARAIHVAHQAGIIHRDLKPTNVLYSWDGVPKITDFGLAKRIDTDDGHTQTGQIMGSPSYMAPEQARGETKQIGPAADVYALGAILYEALTGRPPFKGETPMETVRQVIENDPVTPSRLVPRLPRDLETICLKSLHKEPARRYESAEALADDLGRYLRGEPIRGRRTPAWERGAKWAYRRPIAAMLLATIIASVPIVFGTALYSQRRRDEGKRQEIARLMGVQDKGMRGLLHARTQLDENALNDAEVTLTALKAEIKGESKLGELNAAVDDLLSKVEQRQAEQHVQESNRTRYAEFLRQLNEAFFEDTRFTGLGLASNQDATRNAAQAALALFAAPGSDDSWTLATIPPTLLAQEQATIKDGCYGLLLLLAGVEPTPDRGIRRLEQAALLRPPTPAYHRRRATCLAKAGDAIGAERERREADRLQPATAFDYFLIGQERFRHDDFVTAIRDFEAAIELQPDHFWAQCLSALCRLALKQPSQAKASLNTCINRQRDFAWLYILRGFASSQLAESSPGPDAEADFKAAEADYGRAMDYLGQKPNPELQYVLLVNRGVLRLQRKDFASAERDLRAAIKLNDRPTQAYEALARISQEQGQLDEAIAQLSLAIERRPDWAPLYRARADVDLARKTPDPAQRARALRDLDRAIELEKPGDRALALDYTRKARLLTLDHHEADALRACDVAIKVVPDYLPAHRLRIDLLLNLKEYDEVIRSCDAMMTHGKSSAKFAELRGLARAGLRDYAGAIEDINQALALSRDDAATLMARRGWLYIVSDAPRLALHDFEELIRKDPSNGDAYNGRGSARLRLGEHREAVADAEKALALGKPSQDLYYKSARVYALASVVVGAEVRKRGQDSVRLVTRYQDRAAFLLRQAVNQLPADKRASFWREVIQTDPALRTLRRRLASPDLAGPVTSATGSQNKPAQ
jgi:eukaryotic-like serine/threonine-protein kinase